MNILLTGGTGLIGAPLAERLAESGHTVWVYTRDASRRSTEKIIYINNLLDFPKNRHYDCFINLAGENMARRRWTARRKEELRHSRLGVTRALMELAGRLEKPPGLMLSASAVGFYGHHRNEPLDEDAAPADGFSHRLCAAWEQEARRCEDWGARLCILRLGVVLSPRGGAFQTLARPFRLGVGMQAGSGAQWLSWIHLEDALRAMEFLIERRDIAGAFNLSAPEPVRHRDFSRILRRRLRALAVLPMPGFALRLALGEMAEELLLHGQRVLPRRLQAAGFDFRYPTLPEALSELLPV